MTTELISRCLTPGKHLIGIWSLISLRGITSPCAIQSSTPNKLLTEASPKAISRRTSYLRFRLEFLRYPHVIPGLFNERAFGPPQHFTAVSTCTWIGQSVSGLRHATMVALLRLAFATAPELNSLTLLHNVTRRPVLQKVRDHPFHCWHRALSVCKHMVSDSISLPSRGSFHLSLTVLYSIGH